jgi:bacteriocin-like protein
VMAVTAARATACHIAPTTMEIGMEKLDLEQKPDMQDRELTEQELNEVSGGDGPPGTAG